MTGEGVIMNLAEFSKVFRRFLLSYLIILFIPLLAGLISYHVSLKTAEKYSIMNSTQVLHEGKTILEQRLDEINRFANQLATNSDVNTLLNKNITEKNKIVSSMKQLSTDISPFASTNDFLEDFYIYFRRMDIVMVPGSVYYRPYHFYQEYHYTDFTFSEWKTEVLSHHQGMLPRKAFVMDERNTNVITYIRPLPMNSYSKSMGSIVVPIESSKINNLLMGISTQFNGWVYIMDENNGHIVTTNGIDESEISPIHSRVSMNDNRLYLEDGTLLITAHSDKYNWTYVAGIPSKTLVRQAAPIKYITWLVTIGTLVIGLIICFLFAYRHSRPITGMMKTLKEYTGTESRNDYDFLHGNISKLIATNVDLHSQLAEQKPLLKDAFLKQLLAGELTEKNQNLQEFAALADLPIIGNKGFVSILKVAGYEEMSSSEIYEELHAIRLVIQKESLKLCQKFYVTNLDSDKMVYIFLDDQKDTDVFARDIEQMFLSLKKQFQHQYRISLKVGFGQPFQSLLDISRSYNEAVQALDYITISTNDYHLFWYNEMIKETVLFYYPLDYEFRLLKNLKEGNAEEAKKILQEIYEENINNRCLPKDMLEQVMYEIKGTLFKAFDQYGSKKEELEKVWKNIWDIQVDEESIESLKNKFDQAIECYCQMIADQRKESNHTMIHSIKTFLHEHYQSPDLTIYGIAEHFNRPEKFISHIFKEETGEYLYEYLEKIRMNEAMNLLANSKKTINDIAKEVGYNSAHSFRRAFKRINKVTPNQFRKTLQD